VVRPPEIVVENLRNFVCGAFPGGGLVTRILCVEDNEDNIYLVKMRLEMIEGFEITVARDGAAPVPSLRARANDWTDRSFLAAQPARRRQDSRLPLPAWTGVN
jgi:hypothetical protein